MELNPMSTRIPELIHFARLQSKRKMPLFDELSAVRQELRERRKHFLGSYISLQALVQKGSVVNENIVQELSQYLSSRTIAFWSEKDPGAENFCYQFYELAICAIGSGNVGNESIDDIIQLAECLVRSQDVYVTVMKNLLPPDMIGKLFSFAEGYKDSFYVPTFEDAVLGAVSAFLGVLKDPGGLQRAVLEEEV